jgi:hypothetical protein
MVQTSTTSNATLPENVTEIQFVPGARNAELSIESNATNSKWASTTTPEAPKVIQQTNPHTKKHTKKHKKKKTQHQKKKKKNTKL